MSSPKNGKSTMKAIAKNAPPKGRKRSRLAPPLRHDAPLAVATDGTVFINVNALDAIAHADLAGRSLFIGAALTEAESEIAAELLDNAGHELRAKIAGRLRKPSAQKNGKPQGIEADETK